MQYRTDDLRIKEIKELITPAQLLGDFPITPNAARTVYETRQEIHRILHGADDRLLIIIGPCSIHDVKAAKEYAEARESQEPLRRRSTDRYARLFREAAHDGWLEGIDQRSQPRRQLPDQRGSASARHLLAGVERIRHAGGVRVSRYDYAAVHRRPGHLGRHRRAHHREPSAPRARFGAVLPRRFQERHRRQRAHRRGRDPRRASAASFPFRHQGRPLGHRFDRRQRGLPRDSARRQTAELRSRQRRRRREESRRSGHTGAHYDRFQPRQQLQRSSQTTGRRRTTWANKSPAAMRGYSASWWKAISKPGARISSPARL